MSGPEYWNDAITHSLQSDIGMRRANNQDSATAVTADSELRFNKRGHLFVVADGMGAHAAGELASKMAVEKIPQHFLRSDTALPLDALRKAIIEANREVYLKGQSNPEFHNMGTTVSSLALGPDGVVVGHVGDSRVYRLRRNVLEQLTFDHSLVWEMEANGHVQPNSELSRAIPKNVITRSLGPSPEVAVDMEGPWPVLRGDRYLLCSDGLTGQVEDDEIGMLLGCLPPETVTQVLVDLANLRGGPDNITLIVVQADADFNRSGAPIRGPRQYRTAPPALWVVLGVALLGTALFAIAGLTTAMLGAAATAIIVAVFTAWYCLASTPSQPSDGSVQGPSGRGPYRRYSAKPTLEFAQRLAGTVQALRDAAAEKRWQVPWEQIDPLQAKAAAAVEREDFADAIRWQAKAIVATMQQLRHQRGSEEATVEL
ncbi:PP2C family protein-serine/threonine phosphatase [Roseimaritima ulvae]|uniref:PPM-type phosphatase domain-containing protein n=1 Tax=Roseimaritima ulvae TaxID=980254 RepID=A0A5B9R8A0_9BACT|nr:PP2C family serine/threonine-protein phosphatase [Roseimaritima ulvae]QEG42813.1 Putative protein phosphatase 2C-type [Roseimaritima ulvae]